MPNPNHTANITLEQNNHEIEVYVDVYVYAPQDEDGGAEYDTSEPYLRLDGKNVRAVGLEQEDVDRLEEQAYELANGTHESQTNPSYEPLEVK